MRSLKRQSKNSIKPSRNSTIWPDLCVVIPASGKGIRYGKPKAAALLETGESFLERILKTCREAGLERLCPVLDRDTPDMLSSLRLGFQENPDYSHYLIFPVDFPYVRASTLQALAKASAAHPAAIIRPTYQGRSGHPIIIPATQDWHLELPQPGLAALIQHSGCDILNLELDDPGILRNINHPGD